MKSLKQVFSILAAIAKAKSTAMKSKTSDLKTRLMLFKFLHNKTVLMSVLPQGAHTVKADEKVQDYNKTVVSNKPACNHQVEHTEEEEQYAYTTNPFLELNREEDGDEFDGASESVVDFLTSHGDESFSLENEIDRAADVYIRRFHRQIKIQKQESFKRYQEMLERSV